MSLYDYSASVDIAANHYPFYGLIMAAMRQADTLNLTLLTTAFPDVWRELEQRYNAPGGHLPDELQTIAEAAVEYKAARCGNHGGRGMNADHTCKCARVDGHEAIARDRPHRCSCGTEWGDA